MLEQDKRLAEQHSAMLAQNTELTREVARLTEEMHAAVYKGDAAAAPAP